MVSAQQLNRRITIEEPTEAVNSNGVVIQTWTTYYQPMARILPAIGQEYYQSRQVTASQSVKFQLRYSDKAAAITSKMRILYNSNYYDIDGPPINAYEQNREIVLMGVRKNA